jgi:uncharacterized protein (TIGR03437 family)
MTALPGNSAPYVSTFTVTITVDPTQLTSGSSLTGSVAFVVGSATDTTTVTLNVTAPTKLTLVPQSITFNYTQGDSNLPAAQGIGVFSQPAGASFTASASSSGNWLSVGTGGTTPGSIAVSVNVANLAPGSYTGNINISSANSSVSVPVTINVAKATAPGLSVSPGIENLSAVQGGTPLIGQLTVSNSGGGTLQFTAQATTDQGTWLELNGSGSGSATPSTPAALVFKANPFGLSPGLYTGHITVSDSNSSSSVTVPVVFTVTGAGQSILVSESGLSFTALAGGPQPPAQSFTVSNGGSGSLTWSAQTQQVANPLSTATWLQITPGSGTSAAGQSGVPVSVSVNTTGLPVGTYYGSINITSAGAGNSPQTVGVVLNVTSTTPGISASTGGVLLSGLAGSKTTPQQAVTIFNPSAVAISYSASVFTANGANWLSVSPAAGSATPGSTSLTISANLSNLSSGTQTGTVRLLFGNGNSLVIQVGVIATSTTPTGGHDVAAARPQAQIACSAGKAGYLVGLLQAPLNLSVIQAASPQTVQVQIVDDCGNPVTAASGGAVQVTFSNKDSALNLQDVGSGIWQGTWAPVNAGNAVMVQISASEQGLTLNPASSAGATATVSVAAAGANSAGQATGIANAASAAQAIAGVVAPGSYIAIYGNNLAGTGTPGATTLPLPTSLNGTQLFLGGLPMPLLYASSGQVNAIVPQALAPNASYPFVIVRGSTESVPVQLTVTELQPGIYTADSSGSGQGIVTEALTGQLVSAANPAHAGDFLTVYASGLGSLSGPNGETEPSDGAAAPTTTIFRTTSTITATVGGVPATVTFAGLTPTLAALYQVNVQVPPGAPTGSAVPLVITATDKKSGTVAQSNTVMITVQ